MDITFERGNQGEPKGHALLYFTSSLDRQEIWGTYLVMLPITVDVSKYVPPFLMNQLGDLGPKDLSAFAFPPAPEKLESRKYLDDLAEMRDDDIVYGGSINPSDVASGMMAVNEVVQRYAQLYADLAESRQPSKSLEEEASGGFGVNEVMYGLMSDGDKLNELTKLVGRLRFAMEGGEDAIAREAEADINLLAQHLPEGHQAPRLIESVKSRDARGARLADLYLKRCFHLVQEDYMKLGEVDAEIRALESEGFSS